MLVLAGCATSHGAPLVEMSTGCLGWCEVYEVAVYADGLVEYHGRLHVAYGRRAAHLAPAELAKLERALAGFDRVPRDHCDETDLGTLYAIRYRGRMLSFFDMCPTTSYEALSLAGTIRATVNRWLER
jgi:hypothetical protein